MPISYAMNSCATTWQPADKEGKNAPALTVTDVTRPADTLLLGEVAGAGPDMHVGFTWFHCNNLFTHLKFPGPGGNANFVFFDGHVKTMKWGQTIFPINENKWQL